MRHEHTRYTVILRNGAQRGLAYNQEADAIDVAELVDADRVTKTVTVSTTTTTWRNPNG